VVGEPWHERLVCAHVEGNTWVILTPDGDLYEEELCAPPLLNMIVGDAERTLPPVLGAAAGQPVYRFLRRRNPAELRRHLAEGEAYAATLRPAAELPIAADAARAPAAEAARVPADRAAGEVWLATETVGHVARGTELTPGPGDLVGRIHGVFYVQPGGVEVPVRRLPLSDLGALELAPRAGSLDDRAPGGAGAAASAPPGAEADPGDLRTLAVRYDVSGQRYREYGDAVSLLREDAFDEADFPIEGARTCQWWMRTVKRNGLTPTTHHQKWRLESGVPSSDRSLYEHEILCAALEAGVCTDQLNVANLLMAEIMVRRLQLIEEAHSMSPAHPSYEGAEHWMGLGKRRGGAVINPALTRHVAGRVQEETAVAKERRKAREERRLAPKSEGGNAKGEAKGGAARA